MAVSQNIFSSHIQKISKMSDMDNIIGKIIKSNEKSNTVEIQYLDKNGKQHTQRNVQVRLYGNGGDWFPDVNDLVICQQKDNNLVVIARFFSDFSAEIRSLMKLDCDKLLDIPNNVVGGYIT